MQAKKNLKKRKIEQSPPSAPQSQKRIKKAQKKENSKLVVSFPLIKNLSIESSGNSPIESSFQKIQKPSSSENSGIKSSYPLIENHLLKLAEKSPNETCSQEITRFKLANLDTGEPIQILPDFNTKINKEFVLKPKDQSGYEHLRKMSAKPYEFSFECSQWISTRLVRYAELDNDRFILVNDQIYLQKSENLLLQAYFEDIVKEDIKKTYYFRGPSGIGKSHQLIENVLKYRKKQNYRILHIILDQMYKDSPKWHLLYDFFYCFHNDLEDPDFPKPPSEENWFEFLSNVKLKDESFLNEISKYLKLKNIVFFLIWDQDNVFQNIQKVHYSYPFYPVLSGLRNSEVFNRIIVSAPNDNESFENIDASSVLEINIGFSQEETREFIKNILEKLMGCRIIMNDAFLEVLYQLTNGNGYLLSKFIRAKGQTLQEKFINFAKKMNSTMESNIMKFFLKTQKKVGYKAWGEIFPKILLYLDTEISFPEFLFDFQDKNYTYIKNSCLNSVNNFAKEVFINFYRMQIKQRDKSLYFLRLLSSKIAESNPVFKGILYEHYVVQKLYDDLAVAKNFTYQLKNSKMSENIEGSLKTDQIFLIFINEEIEALINQQKNGCFIKPFKFNHPVFDFVVWDGKNKVLYFMKITINLNHSAVDERFFKEKNFEFLRNIQGVDKIRFIWVVNSPQFESKFTDKDDRIGYLTITI